MENLGAFDAIVFQPIMLKMLRNPRIHAVVGPGITFWVQLDLDATEIPDTVPAVALLDGLAHFGMVPTAHIGIGVPNNRIIFKVDHE